MDKEGAHWAEIVAEKRGAAAAPTQQAPEISGAVKAIADLRLRVSPAAYAAALEVAGLKATDRLEAAPIETLLGLLKRLETATGGAA
jgi:hypothetical protein